MVLIALNLFPEFTQFCLFFIFRFLIYSAYSSFYSFHLFISYSRTYTSSFDCVCFSYWFFHFARGFPYLILNVFFYLYNGFLFSSFLTLLIVNLLEPTLQFGLSFSSFVFISFFNKSNAFHFYPLWYFIKYWEFLLTSLQSIFFS